MANPEKALGLYVHIPYCLSKCDYCDFCSKAGSSKKERARYLDALKLNIEDMGKETDGYYCDTVFIGGGTPPTIGQPAMERLIDTLCRNFYVCEDAEFTVEMNPATVEPRFARSLKQNGVNRISMGLQSANDAELRALGRIHTLRDFEKSYFMLRDAGFDNVNVDLMFGIPDQTEESFANTLKYLVSLEPEHISVYGLQLEPGTPLYENRAAMKLPGEDAEYAMYRYATEYLAANGYGHYEISNFARKGYECRHNKRYWNSELYVGLGAAAHSDFGGRRYGYTADVDEYIDHMERADFTAGLYSENEILTPESIETEYVMLRFRLGEGIDKRAYNALFGADFDAKYRERLKPFIDGKFVVDTPERCAFTTDGMFVSNSILSAVLDL